MEKEKALGGEEAGLREEPATIPLGEKGWASEASGKGGDTIIRSPMTGPPRPFLGMLRGEVREDFLCRGARGEARGGAVERWPEDACPYPREEEGARRGVERRGALVRLRGRRWAQCRGRTAGIADPLRNQARCGDRGRAEGRGGWVRMEACKGERRALLGGGECVE